MIALDHVGLPARDPAASARFFTELLGLPPPRPDGPDGDMFCVTVGTASLLYAPAAHPASVHLALRVDEPRFHEVVARLRARSLAFGNDPEAPGNGRIDDPLGGRGRVYFLDPDGHLFEVTVTV